MFSAALLTVVLLIRVIPSFIDMSVDSAYIMLNVADLSIISLLLWNIYTNFTWERWYIKIVCLTTMGINSFFIVNFMYNNAPEGTVYLEQLIGL